MSGRIFQNVVLQFKETTDRTIGVIDSDYRGEIGVGLRNNGAADYTVQPGERIAQLMFMPCLAAAFTVTDTLDDTERGEGGFGSTGKM